ncbi:MAG: N-acetylneuraminate synthase [Bacteroidales bacterium]|nr:N-acetylneuraminate synthase [Bacteroidales bacterium]
MQKVIIIAEAGVNHNGDINQAKKLIDVASEAGADYVKFQTAKLDSIITKSAQKAEYQKEATGSEESQYEMIKKLLLSEEDHYELKRYAEHKNIKFLSTPFDLESVDFLYHLGMDFFKIPSGEITNYPYLVSIAKKRLPVVLSTGMANIEEIDATISILLDNGIQKDQLTVLHANTEYPTPMKDVNLKAMLSIQDTFDVKVGYSDHTLGIEVPIAAVAMGARVIEKHFTLNRNLPGPDHKASLEPSELKAMVNGIRNIELALGTGVKKASESELKNKSIARKSIVAIKNIKKGDALNINNISIKRPGTGLSPMLWNKVIGSTAIKDFNIDDLIEI